MPNDDLSILARHLHDANTGLTYVCMEDMIAYFEQHRDFLNERAEEAEAEDEHTKAAYLRGAGGAMGILAEDLTQGLA